MLQMNFFSILSANQTIIAKYILQYLYINLFASLAVKIGLHGHFARNIMFYKPTINRLLCKCVTIVCQRALTHLKHLNLTRFMHISLALFSVLLWTCTYRI